MHINCTLWRAVEISLNMQNSVRGPFYDCHVMYFWDMQIWHFYSVIELHSQFSLLFSPPFCLSVSERWNITCCNITKYYNGHLVQQKKYCRCPLFWFSGVPRLLYSLKTNKQKRKTILTRTLFTENTHVVRVVIMPVPQETYLWCNHTFLWYLCNAWQISIILKLLLNVSWKGLLVVFDPCLTIGNSISSSCCCFLNSL